MKLQEMFDTVLTHMRVQRCKSVENGRCRYRGSDGKRCPIGFLIPDDMYEERYENQSISDLPSLANKLGLNLPLAVSLQVAHDSSTDANFMVEYEQKMAAIADAFGLKYTPETTGGS